MLDKSIFDVCVIGSGPAGIIASLELESEGLKVLLVESGSNSFNNNIQSNSDAVIKNTTNHAPMNEATRVQLGGTSLIWGGRCVPLDPIDFQARDQMEHTG